MTVLVTLYSIEPSFGVPAAIVIIRMRAAAAISREEAIDWSL
jgi:hypothetical protein